MITGAWRGSSQSAQDKSTVAPQCTHRLVLQARKYSPPRSARRRRASWASSRVPARSTNLMPLATYHHQVPARRRESTLSTAHSLRCDVEPRSAASRRVHGPQRAQRVVQIVFGTRFIPVAHHLVVLSQPRQCCSMKRMTSGGRASHSTVEGQRCGFMEVNVISSGHCRAAAFNIGMVFIADVGFPFDTMTVSAVGLRIGVH